MIQLSAIPRREKMMPVTLRRVELIASRGLKVHAGGVGKWTRRVDSWI